MTSPMTKETKMIQAALEIRSAVANLRSLSNFLPPAIDLISNPSQSQARKNKVMRELKLMQTTIATLADQLVKNVKVLDPIGSLSYAHARQKQTPLMDMTNKRTAPVPSPLAPPAKKPKKTKATLPASFVLPTPKAGKVYSKLEVVEILKDKDPATKNYSNLVTKMINDGLVPVKRAQLNKLVATFRQHGSNHKAFEKEWGETGREAIISSNDIQSIVAKLHSKPGACFNKENVEGEIIEVRKQTMIANGFQPLTDAAVAPSEKTVRNYQALIAIQPNVSITRTAIVKSHTRTTAEASLRSAMAFILTTAATHFVLSDKLDPDVNRDFKNPNAVSEASKFLFEKVLEANDNRPLQPVQRAFIMSTDDTTEFVFQGAEGTNLSKQAFKLVSGTALASAGTRSKFTTGAGESTGGLRVKLTHTFAANGAMAPLFVSICGLTDRELPKQHCPSGLLVLQVQEMSVGGHSTGTVVFVRNDHDKQTDKVRFRAYRDNILLPFIEMQRANCAGWTKGSPIDDSMQVVSWCDGDLQQVATIVEDETLAKFKELKIVSNKQSAARSATEQAADLARVFKNQHRLQRMTSVKNVHESNHPMKRTISKGFETMSDQGLNLNSTKTKALIDFLSCIPEVLTKAGTRSHIVHGFVANGLVGDEAKFSSKFAFPDFDVMLATVRRNVTIQEHQLCKSAFPELLKIQMENGFVSECEFDRLGFPLDLDPFGNEAPKTAGISQECRQRAKCLSHSVQVKLRMEREMKLEAEEQRKAAAKINRCHKLLEDNKSCENRVSEAPTIEGFAKCQAKELQAFIHVRKFQTMQTEENWKWPNKGKRQEAEEGANNMIKMAFDCREKEIVFNLPTTTTTAKPTTPQANNRHVEATVVTVSPKQSPFSNETMASTFLGNDRWVLAVQTALDPHNHCHIQSIDEALKQRADTLQRQLEERMMWHCQIRIEKPEKRNHWCLRWAAKNFPAVAAIMVMFDHTKKDLSCLDNNQCLLAKPSSFLKVANMEKSQEGCYLYFDTNNEEWIRSGKAVGSNFEARHNQHALGSKLTTVASQKSKFYTFYPSHQVKLADERARKGTFENLQMFVGIGFKKLIKGKLTHDFTTDNGIFHFDAATKESINAVRFSSISMRLDQKQLHMLGYLWELCYDLCIARDANISGNPGFETVLGIFG